MSQDVDLTIWGRFPLEARDISLLHIAQKDSVAKRIVTFSWYREPFTEDKATGA
jgi:hypothetical protein